MDAHVDKFIGLEAENSWISGLVASLSSVTQEARLSEEMKEWELSPMECRNGLDLQLREKGKKQKFGCSALRIQLKMEDLHC